jgi:hypothetical protein
MMTQIQLLLRDAWLQAAKRWMRCNDFHQPAIQRILACCLLASAFLAAQGAELNFADYNDHGLFNNFSGDSGTFASGRASITAAFDTGVFHGTNGAALRIDYSLPSGFCGLWNSLIGKVSFPKYSLNFTNLYGPLRNSPGNPSRLENVRVVKFSFWARGNGAGDFAHQVRVEFKNTQGVLVGGKIFAVSNQTNWARYDFPISDFESAGLSQIKELVFVIEDWRNNNRTGCFFIDDLSFTTDEMPCAPAHWGDDAMLDLVSQRAFFYFLTFTDDLGFALDRSTFSDMVSTGTVGFQLAAYCIGHKRGWADRLELENRVVAILQNLNNLPMGPEPGVSRSGYRGFYYHFLNANTGARKDRNVELSLYDTMLLMYGVLTCKEYFTANPRVQTLSQQLFDRVEWDWFVDRSPGTNANCFYLAWIPGPTPGGTFLKDVDGQTDEALMVDILALGSKTHPTSFDTYLARHRVCGAYPAASPNNIMVSWKGSLFNYFFASCWLDLQPRGYDLHPTFPRDIWQNGKLAIFANRQFCIDHASSRAGCSGDLYATYGATAWGLSSCDNLVRPAPGLASEYYPFGALPTEENIQFGTKALHAGTIPVYAAASSINFLPEASLAALRHYFDIPGLWCPLFGFGDAFSLDPHYLGPAYDADGNPEIHFADFLNGPWINHMAMGINVGPMLLAIENYRSRDIWNLTAKNPEIQTGLARVFGLGPPPRYDISIEQTADDTRVNLRWDPVPGASEYSIFSSTDLTAWNLRQGGIKDTAWTDPNVGKNTQRFYYLKAILPAARCLTPPSASNNPAAAN